jgi:hypothetical protein
VTAGCEHIAHPTLSAVCSLLFRRKPAVFTGWEGRKNA